MNPLDLYGPEFLVFFAIYGVLVWRALELLQAYLEKSDGPLPRLTDPYAIGYLRAGVRGALQVAIVSLVHRGLVGVKRDQLVRESYKGDSQGGNAGEQEVLGAAGAGLKAHQVVREPRIVDCCSRTLEPELAASGLMPNEPQKMRRGLLCISAILLVAGLALTKILVAWSRGRHNIGFLILEAAIFAFILLRTMLRVRKRKGTEVLDSLVGLFGHLKRRSDQLQLSFEERELMMLAAVFGTPLVPS